MWLVGQVIPRGIESCQKKSVTKIHDLHTDFWSLDIGNSLLQKSNEKKNMATYKVFHNMSIN